MPQKQERLLESVDRSLACMDELLDGEAAARIAQLRSIEAMNASSTAKYQELATAAHGRLHNDAETLTQTYLDIQRYAQQIQGVHRQIASLQELVSELDKWSKHVEAQCRKSLLE